MPQLVRKAQSAGSTFASLTGRKWAPGARAIRARSAWSTGAHAEGRAPRRAGPQVPPRAHGDRGAARRHVRDDDVRAHRHPRRVVPRVFSLSLADVDVVVRGEPAAGDDDSRRFSDSILARSRDDDGVATAEWLRTGLRAVPRPRRRHGRPGRSVARDHLRRRTLVGPVVVGRRRLPAESGARRSRRGRDGPRHGPCRRLPRRRRGRRALRRTARAFKLVGSSSSAKAPTPARSRSRLDLPTSERIAAAPVCSTRST